MKSKLFSMIATFAILLAMGGAPALHGLVGRDWGKAVSGLAQTYPGAVADHINAAK